MKYLGKEMQRVDGVAKVTGRARYAAEFSPPGLTHGYLVTSTIANGRIRRLDVGDAERAPGVLKVITHENSIKPENGSRPGGGFRALVDDRIRFNAQPIALVVAETLEQARHAATLVRAEYDSEPPQTDVLSEKDALDTGKANQRGDAEQAFAAADVRVESVSTIPIEHHNPMEPHGGVGFWQGDKLTIFNKSQNVWGDRQQVANYFGIPNDNVRLLSLFVGGAFGSSLAPHYYTFLLGVASKLVGRPVKLSYTRRQMYTGHGHRPFYWQRVSLGASRDGKLQSILADVAIDSSADTDYGEGDQRVARSLYACPNVRTRHRSVRLNVSHPSPMRAPGMVSNVTALEIAMDELAYACKVDPIELRLINYADKDPESGKPFSSKALRECYALGAREFGWDKRNPEPRSMRDGRFLVGWGMATGTWPAMFRPAAARVTIRVDGTATVGSATSDIGPGTYTVMTLIAAEYLGIEPAKIKFELGDTRLPQAPPQGGSFTTASVGTAIFGAAKDLRSQLLQLVKDREAFTNLDADQVELVDAKFQPIGNPADGVLVIDLLRASDKAELTAEYRALPSPERENYATAAHGAQFVEVKVDPQTGMVKVTRCVEASACGKILNPLTSHSQEIGGIVWGIGMALTEITEIDHRFGRIMNPQLADYHIPVNADAIDIKTMFVEEDDKIINPLGVKGMGELGMVGVPAAIVNAIYHATGIRIRDLPITPDKLIAAGLSA